MEIAEDADPHTHRQDGWSAIPALPDDVPDTAPEARALPIKHLGGRRALALAALSAALAAYTAGAGELWNAGLWPS